MTATTPLVDRLSKDDLRLFKMGVVNLIAILSSIRNPVTAGDFEQAVWKFADECGIPDYGMPTPEATDVERTEADNAPLYVRISREGPRVRNTLAETMIAFNLLQAAITLNDRPAGNELYQAYVNLGQALGLPAPATQAA